METDDESESSDAPDIVVKHMAECDRMFCKVYGSCPHTDDFYACRKLLKMGLHLDSASLPKVCINQCDRWSLPTRPQKPHQLPDMPGIV